MNDLPNNCEQWAEPISLLAAGCLSSDEVRDVRQHVDNCPDCRKRFQQLTVLCGKLAETPLRAGHPKTNIVERVITAIASDAASRPSTRQPVEMIQPRLLSRSLNKWRWIMRSPISRISAAAVAVLTVTGIAFLFYGSGASLAFADFATPIVEAKSAKFKMTTEIRGPNPVTSSGEVFVLGGTRTRHELVTKLPGIANSKKTIESKTVMIFDWNERKSLTLSPANKTAIVVSLANLNEQQIAQQDMFATFRSILLDGQRKQGYQRKPLGDKEIAGRRVVGFRLSGHGTVVDLWGDPQTGLPVLAEATMSMFPNAKTTMSDFVFNLDIDEELMSVKPPEGYTVQNIKADASPPNEQDLIIFFREYHHLSGGHFPDTLDLQETMKLAGKKLAAEMAAEKSNTGDQSPNEEKEREKTQARIQKSADLQLRLQRGLIFARAVLPSEADAHYAGQGVSFGDADVPIFWYSPEDTQTYRVINARLEIRDADTPPQVANAQRVSTLGGQRP